MISTATVVALLDNTDEAHSVLASAHALLAKDVPSMLHTVHVVDEMGAAMQRYLFPYACFGDDHDAVVSDLLSSGRAVLQRRLNDQAGYDDRFLRVVYGRVADRALKEFESLGPDLVVVGATSSEHPEVGVIGKNASRIVRRARSPVLVVREKIVRPYKRAGVALDLGRDSAPLLSDAVAFAHARGAEVIPMHVLSSIAARDHRALESSSTESLDEASKRALDREYNKVLSGLSLPFPIQQNVKSILKQAELTQGDPGEALVKHIQDADIDLLIMYRCRSSSGSGLRLGRVAEYALRYASCDVLVLPPPIVRDAG